MNNKRQKGGLGLISVLTLIFVVLKLLNLINWSWIWVLCPLWISLFAVIISFAFVLVGGRIKKGKW